MGLKNKKKVVPKAGKTSTLRYKQPNNKRKSSQSKIKSPEAEPEAEAKNQAKVKMY